MKSQLSNEQTRKDISKGMKLLGDSWTLLIIERLMVGDCRFNDLQRELCIAPSVLTNRLNRLINTKMIEKQHKTVNELSVSYSLTGRGRDMDSVLRALSVFIRNNNFQ